MGILNDSPLTGFDSSVKPDLFMGRASWSSPYDSVWPHTFSTCAGLFLVGIVDMVSPLDKDRQSDTRFSLLKNLWNDDNRIARLDSMIQDLTR